MPEEQGRGIPDVKAIEVASLRQLLGGPHGPLRGKDGDVQDEGLWFQVSDVQKPLAAVWRIAERGNLIQFGPKDEDNFITNKETRKKIMMVRRNGSYVIEAEFVQQPGFPRQAEM